MWRDFKYTNKPPRLYVDSSEYFLTFYTFKREIELGNKERDIIWESLIFQEKSLDLELVNFVILADHVHVLIRIENARDVSIFLDRVKSYTSRKIGNLQIASTPIWQRGTYDRVVRNDEELEAYFDYIVFNPIKHGLVTDSVEWPYLYKAL